MSEFEQKIYSLLETIDKKLDILIGTSSQTNVDLHKIPETGGTVKPSLIVEKQEEEDKALEKPPIEGRRICPKCGGTTFNTVEDLSHVLFQQGGMKIYAKSYICRNCGTKI